LEDWIQQARIRRETAMARERLRLAEEKLRRTVETTGERPPVIRGLDRIERALTDGLILWTDPFLGGEEDPARNPFDQGGNRAVEGVSTREKEPKPQRSEAEVDRRMDELLEELRARQARRERASGAPGQDALGEIDRLLDKLSE